jgi:hypothetical protein
MYSEMVRLFIPINPKKLKNKIFDPYIVHDSRSYDLSSRSQLTKKILKLFLVLFHEIQQISTLLMCQHRPTLVYKAWLKKLKIVKKD